MNRDFNQFVEKLEDNDWTVEVTGGGHLRLVPPDDGNVIFTASTPSDHRALLNLKATVRRGRPDADYAR